jgi:hypothetical protein
VEVAWNKGDDAREVTRHTQRGALAWSRLFWRQVIGPFLRSRICTDSFYFKKINKMLTCNGCIRPGSHEVCAAAPLARCRGGLR